MKQFDILSLGSVYLDITLTDFPFRTELPSDQEIVGNNYEMTLGGSAVNFSRCCASLGLHPIFVGKIGSDWIGKRISNFLKKENVGAATVESPDVKSNINISVVNGQGNAISMVAGSANQSLSPADITENVKKLFGQSKYFYVGGYFKLKKLQAALYELVQEAHKRGVIVVFDHGRVNNAVSKDEINEAQKFTTFVDIYFPNDQEINDVWGGATIEESVALCQRKTKALVVVKEGANGATAFLQNEEPKHSGGFRIAPLNTVGAGDAFNAGFITAQIHGMNLEESMRFANATAALKISQNALPVQFAVEKLMSI